MKPRSQKKNVSMQQLITALLDPNNVFPPAYLQHFSDLEGKDLQDLRAAWPQVTDTRRFLLLEDLEELAEVDTLVSFDNVGRMALDDPDPRVRTVAIRLLWETIDPRLAAQFMDLLVKDPSSDVRAGAASALGSYIYQGELEEISEELLHKVEESLLRAAQGSDDALVRRRAVEALGFSGRSEVPGLIREAYTRDEGDWLITALFAMGRSADNIWEPDVKRMLHHPKVDVQFEAVRAAGELGLESTRRILLDLLEEEAQDTDVRSAAIWSLSQIGGEEVRDVLETLLEESDDDDEIAILENALDNLSFTEDTGLYNLIDLDKLGLPGDEEEDYRELAGLTGAVENNDEDGGFKEAVDEDDLPITGNLPAAGDPPTGGTGSETDQGKSRKRHRK